MGEPRCYAAHGLCVQSPVPLPAPVVAGPPDVIVRLGPRRTIPWRRPASAVVAELIGPDGWPRYSFCRRGDGGITARVYSLADFGISADRREIVARAGHDIDEEILGILLAGSIASFLLMERGECVLHASAVELSPGRAVAFAGFSARGKTTSAALLCAAGRPLVTDDVLGIDLDGDVPRCGPGGAELRLRPQQAGLAAAFGPGAEVRETADERLAVRPALAPSASPELVGVVVPTPTREDDVIRLEPLDLGASTTELLAAPRIEGWRRRPDQRRVFDHAVDIATRVPVLRAHIPWGPPFPDDTAAALAAGIEAALATPAGSA
ncbi:MAG: hypothetical protein JHC95_02180 [Solirubrobacteraceae bacterium]|nr:hypothetical protein [Solirubrobacteraceae bacterium]